MKEKLEQENGMADSESVRILSEVELVRHRNEQESVKDE
jgi:hypothetical protein